MRSLSTVHTRANVTARTTDGPYQQHCLQSTRTCQIGASCISCFDGLLWRYCPQKSHTLYYDASSIKFAKILIFVLFVSEHTVNLHRTYSSNEFRAIAHTKIDSFAI